MKDPRPAMISARPSESRSTVANCSNTRTGSSELSTVTALDSRMRCVRTAAAASTTAGADTAKSARWCSPTPNTSSPTSSARTISSIRLWRRCGGLMGGPATPVPTSPKEESPISIRRPFPEAGGPNRPRPSRGRLGPPASGNGRLMEIGLSSFGDVGTGVAGPPISPQQRLHNLLEEIVLADEVGLDVFGVGEHHRADFAVSAPAVVLAAAAVRTPRIRPSRAVTVPIAISGGAPERFAPLVQLHRDAAQQAGHPPLPVATNCHTYVADTTKQAADEFFEPYSSMMNRIGRE